eukprot:jgi/Tetstr1/437996/TSEL_002847.t2
MGCKRQRLHQAYSQYPARAGVVQARLWRRSRPPTRAAYGSHGGAARIEQEDALLLSSAVWRGGHPEEPSAYNTAWTAVEGVGAP